MVEQDGEFVTTDTRHYVAFPQGQTQLLAHLAQDFITCGVTVAGIDHLEMIQIQMQQAGLVFANGLKQILFKGCAIVQAGEQVVALLPCQHAHVVLLLRNIVQDHHRAGVHVVLLQRSDGNTHSHTVLLCPGKPMYAFIPVLVNAWWLQHFCGKWQDFNHAATQQAAKRHIQQA